MDDPLEGVAMMDGPCCSLIDYCVMGSWIHRSAQPIPCSDRCLCANGPPVPSTYDSVSSNGATDVDQDHETNDPRTARRARDPYRSL